jgi:hypothetical protein
MLPEAEKQVKSYWKSISFKVLSASSFIRADILLDEL